MGKKFDDKKRIDVKSSIYETAYKMFSVSGYKKTTVNKIVDAVGIAKGTFYLFYPSKEALFFRLVIDHEKLLGLEMHQELETMSKNTDFLISFKTIIKNSINSLRDDAFMKIALDSQLMMYVYSKIDESLKEESIKNDIDKFEAQITIGQKHGYTLKTSVETLSSCMRVLVFSFLNEEILDSNSEEIMDILILGTLKELFKKYKKEVK